jgi:hypothetical protein
LPTYTPIFQRIFPGIQKLDIKRRPTQDSFSTMNSLEFLREIRISETSFNILSQINYPRLEKIIVYCTARSDIAMLAEFIERHPNIQWLELNGGYNWMTGMINRIKSLKNLKILRVLKITSETQCSSFMEVIEFIGKNLSDLEHLEIVLHEINVKKALKSLRASFPRHGCDSRKHKKIIRWRVHVASSSPKILIKKIRE